MAPKMIALMIAEIMSLFFHCQTGSGAPVAPTVACGRTQLSPMRNARPDLEDS
jgi:hypothetical protein